MIRSSKDRTINTIFQFLWNLFKSIFKNVVKYIQNVKCFMFRFYSSESISGVPPKKFQITYKSCSILYTFFQSSKMKLAVENILGWTWSMCNLESLKDMRKTSEKIIWPWKNIWKSSFCLVNICHNNVAFDQSFRRVNNVDLLVNLGLNALFNRLLFAWH